jgi:hypothetical protein
VSSLVPRSLSARFACGALLALMVIAAMATAHAGIRSERLLAAILKATPEATLVPSGEQLSRADEAAARIGGATAFWGVGKSMEPLFPSETAIVVAPIRFKDLRKGMTVVYFNRRGRMVAHSLTGDLPKGWIAQGVNNDKEDDDLVTKQNLVGVIVQAYAAMESQLRIALTEELVAKGRLPASRT